MTCNKYQSYNILDPTAIPCPGLADPKTQCIISKSLHLLFGFVLFGFVLLGMCSVLFTFGPSWAGSWPAWLFGCLVGWAACGLGAGAGNQA